MTLRFRNTGSSQPPWSFNLEITARELLRFDSLPAIVDRLAEDNGLPCHKGRLLTIVMELFNNAVDHGVLRMDQSLKDTEAGFFLYYERREQALAEVDSGWIRLSLQCIRSDAGGRVIITLNDSGTGFDDRHAGAELADNVRHGGRGIALVRSLCSELIFQHGGNRVKAVYTWTDAAS